MFPVLAGSNPSGYNLTRSLRFRSSASAYLSRTPSTSGTGGGKTWTFSAWIKRGSLAVASGIFDAYNTSGPSTDSLAFRSDDTLTIYFANAGGGNLTTTQVFRDPSAWYHVVVALDTTQATASNRVKIYLNGTQITAFSTANYPSQNAVFNWGNTQANNIGRKASAGDYYDGYLTEINFIDGQALTPSSFGSINTTTGVWRPARYVGTYGTNGFYLPFTDNSVPTTTSNVGIGKDFSGNGNYWTSNNINVYGGTVQSFTSSTTWTAPTGVTSVNYLVVAGGGGGGSAATGVSMGGGGGAGGLLQGQLTVVPGTTYTVTVGAGGSAGTNGGNSVFGSITATGGGAGAGGISSFVYAQNGGSGGGGGPYTGLQKGSGIAGQGFDGGSAGNIDAAGGGGGSSGVGGSISSGTVGGAGGPGTVVGITGSNVTYAGGGGGGAYLGYTGGAGGSGGGGAGGANADGANATGYGSGGGGAGQYGNTHVGGSGSGGIVILAYGSSPTYDSMTDVPTLTSATAANFATGNPLSVGANTSLTNGNLSGTLTGSGGWSATICGLTSGKWYYEATVTANSGNSMWVGFLSDVYTKNDNAWSFSTQTALYANDARNGNNSSYGATWTTNDVIGVALDLSTSSGSVTFYKNGVSQGVMFSSLTSSAVWRPLISGGGTGTTIAMNFGQRPFAYTPPTGYVALNTYNLPTSTIVKGNTVMDATTYTGNGSTQTITNSAGFKPDFVWQKSRSNAISHILNDSVRGVSRTIYSNLTNAEANYPGYNVTAFNSNGFTVGDDSAGNYGSNGNGQTYVGWQWQAGQGTTSTNTNGSITSTVSVNASAGFSIVTYTGTGSAGTIGHGLGVAPQLIIVKPRSATVTTDSWNVYHTSTGNTQFLVLNATDAATSASNRWNNTSPTSSVFSIGTVPSSNAVGYVAYCWTPIAGYSAFGSYTGNGSTDGPFVYTGFRPKFIMIKGSSFVSNWFIEDSARNGYNVNDGVALRPNLSNAEDGTTTYNLDILSNGFKLRSSAGDSNTNGATFVYAAFAENPTKNALAR